MSPSLNTIQPENVAHGSEIFIQAQGPTGAYVTIAEVFNMTYDADQKLEQMPVMGTRRYGYRRGRYDVKGTIKAYWLNSYARSMVLGNATPGNAGSNPLIYLSQTPFTRYQMIVINANWPGNAILNPYLIFVNTTFSKDTITWDADKITTEDIAFTCEDIYGQ